MLVHRHTKVIDELVVDLWLLSEVLLGLSEKAEGCHQLRLPFPLVEGLNLKNHEQAPPHHDGTLEGLVLLVIFLLEELYQAAYRLLLLSLISIALGSLLEQLIDCLEVDGERT